MPQIAVQQGDGIPGGSEKVRALQQALMQAGYALPQYGADGQYGEETASAVLKWKKSLPGGFAPQDGSYVTRQEYRFLTGQTDAVPAADSPATSAGLPLGLLLGGAGLIAYLLSN